MCFFNSTPPHPPKRFNYLQHLLRHLTVYWYCETIAIMIIKSVLFTYVSLPFISCNDGFLLLMLLQMTTLQLSHTFPCCFLPEHHKMLNTGGSLLFLYKTGY